VDLAGHELMKRQDRAVGIIGGMGPAATIDLQQRILDLTPATDDAGHLRVLVDNNPKVPSRIAALLEGGDDSPLPCLVTMARGLVNSGAELLAMPCNTAHFYYDELAQQVTVPILNLIDLVGDLLQDMLPRPRRVGLLASTAVQRVDLYGPALSRRGMQVLFPDAGNQRKVMALIRAVKAKTATPGGQAALQFAAQDLAEQGADVLVVACTELSTLAGVSASGMVVVDAMQVLAETIVRLAREGASSSPGGRVGG
jgi:aspartate racemase